MTPTLRVIITLAIVAGAIAGTYLLDTNPAWSGLFYLGAVALWFALDADDSTSTKEYK
jgi:hypothetical protein